MRLRLQKIVSNDLYVAILLFEERHVATVGKLNPLGPRNLLEKRPDALVLRLIVDRVDDERGRRDGVEPVDDAPSLEGACDRKFGRALPVL